MNDIHYSDAQKELMVKNAFDYINSFPTSPPKDLMEIRGVLYLAASVAKNNKRSVKFPGTRWIIDYTEGWNFGENPRPEGYLLGLFFGGRVVAVPTMDLGLLAAIIHQNKEI